MFVLAALLQSEKHTHTQAVRIMKGEQHLDAHTHTHTHTKSDEMTIVVVFDGVVVVCVDLFQLSFMLMPTANECCCVATRDAYCCGC